MCYRLTTRKDKLTMPKLDRWRAWVKRRKINRAAHRTFKNLILMKEVPLNAGAERRISG